MTGFEPATYNLGSCQPGDQTPENKGDPEESANHCTNGCTSDVDLVQMAKSLREQLTAAQLSKLVSLLFGKNLDADKED